MNPVYKAHSVVHLCSKRCQTHILCSCCRVRTQYLHHKEYNHPAWKKERVPRRIADNWLHLR